MSSVGALLERWRGEADFLRRRGMGSRAELVDSMADELESVVRGSRHETVNLQVAAELSGYSASHLGRMIRQGKIPNAGRRNAPRIRFADLPRKAGCTIDDGSVPVLTLHQGRGIDGLDEGRERGRVRVQRRGDAARRVSDSLPPVG